MLFNPEFLFIYRNCIEHISMPFNLKILVCTFSVHTHFVNTIQFKILNKKCNFSIQLHPIEFKIKSKNIFLFKICIQIEKF